MVRRQVDVRRAEHHRWCSATLIVTVAAGAALSATVLQPPAQQPQPPSEPTADALAPEPVEPAEVYTYDPAGRRDPFVSLLNRGTELPPAGERATGLEGLSINEVALRGIVLSDGAHLAVLQAPDEKTYIVRDNDKLFDGFISSITTDAVVFMQEVNDPLSLVTEREVRRPLRGVEDAR